MKHHYNSENVAKVLVLGNDNRAFLSVIRSLGRKNICVHVGWCDKHLVALNSKYISKQQNIPPYILDDNTWKEELIKLLQREKYDLVIPCNDQSIIPLQMYKSELTTICNIYLLSDPCYKIANDKYLMQKLVKRLGINTAKELSITNQSNVQDIISEITLPVVIKPRSSFVANNLHTKRSVHKAFSINELQAYLEKVDDKEILSVQKNFIGDGVGIEVLAHHGEILFSFQHLRIHEPIYGGGSSYRKSTDQHPELLEASKKIIRKLDYTGVAMLEFKMNFSSEEWIFIEFNARFWGSLPLAIASGADFPYFLYELIVNDRKEFPKHYKKGIYCRNLSSDLKWFISNLKEDRSNPILMSRPLWKVFLGILNILKLKERNDTIVIDDFKPGIRELIDIINSIIIEIKIKFYSLTVIRHLYYYRSRKNVISAKKVLIVCKGNICRSPFAHYYLENRRITGLSISSCGYYPEENRSCPKEAIKAAKQFGTNLSSHRSKILKDNMIDNADLIFIFDSDNWREIIKRFPSAKSKIQLITSLNTTKLVTINDPFGKEMSYFTETYKNIKISLDSFLSVRNPS